MENDYETFGEYSVLTEEQLKENLKTLLTKKKELENKIKWARYNNISEYKFNVLLTMYTSLCGLIAGYEVAAFTFAACTAGIIISDIKGCKKVSDLENQKQIVDETLLDTSAKLSMRK